MSTYSDNTRWIKIRCSDYTIPNMKMEQTLVGRLKAVQHYFSKLFHMLHTSYTATMA